MLIQLIQPPFENVLQHQREQKHAKLHDESTSVPNGKNSTYRIEKPPKAK